ncbi:hypothetical protein E8F11_11860 [Pseudomonas sp. BN417]|nr:hypothetical protein [Pseudomonas sp. BN417]
MESFFGTLKSEFFYLSKFNSPNELEAGPRDYIHYYNHSRIRLKQSGLSPVEYRTPAAGPAYLCSAIRKRNLGSDLFSDQL